METTFNSLLRGRWCHWIHSNRWGCICCCLQWEKWFTVQWYMCVYLEAWPDEANGSYFEARVWGISAFSCNTMDTENILQLKWLNWLSSANWLVLKNSSGSLMQWIYPGQQVARFNLLFSFLVSYGSLLPLLSVMDQEDKQHGWPNWYWEMLPQTLPNIVIQAISHDLWVKWIIKGRSLG